MAEIQIYTDGSSRGNPGRGGFGVVLLSGQHRKEIAQGYQLTTNNRMELMAVIVALETLKGSDHQVTIFTDSQYVVNSIEKKWVFGWKKKNFVGKKNADLWQRFLNIYPQNTLKLVWVKGHATNQLNNHCDLLATTAADGNALKKDEGYLQNIDTTAD